MESTFIIKKEDFNSEFVEAVKKLFSTSRQLQITINTSEDFNLLKPETGKEYLNRLKKAIDDIDKKRNVVTISDAELDEMVLPRL